MKKGSGTRSGLLWEVERLLNETENLPQILLMENVPQVISADNIDDFHSWCSFLESKGYKCYTQILNAKDYGVAQNRERCFMVSILGDYSDIKVPLVVIYDSPKDFPGKVVARVWDGEKNRPTNVYCEYENLKRCEADVMSAGFIFKFPRTPEDDACIVETYMR